MSVYYNSMEPSDVYEPADSFEGIADSKSEIEIGQLSVEQENTQKENVMDNVSEDQILPESIDNDSSSLSSGNRTEGSVEVEPADSFEDIADSKSEIEIGQLSVEQENTQKENVMDNVSEDQILPESIDNDSTSLSSGNRMEPSVVYEPADSFEGIADSKSEIEIGQLSVEQENTQKENVMDNVFEDRILPESIENDSTSLSSGNRFSRKLKTMARNGLHRICCISTTSYDLVSVEKIRMEDIEDDEMIEDFVRHDEGNIEDLQDIDFLSEDSTLVIASLGQQFQLGTLYDCRNDQLVPNVTLWDEDSLKEATCSIPKPNSSFEIFTEDSLSQKLLSLDVGPNLSLSVMCGLVDVSCSRNYLGDYNPSKNQVRVILNYCYTSHLEHIRSEKFDARNFQHSAVIMDCATHVVTGILYGAEAFFVFDREVMPKENIREIHGKIEYLVNSIPGACGVKGRTYSKIRENDKKEMTNLQCKLYCDVLPEENPTTFQDAVELCKRFPQLFSEDAMKLTPKKIRLFPLNKLDDRAPGLVREISTNLVTQIQNDIESLRTIEMRCVELERTKVYNVIPDFKDQISHFMEMVNTFRNDFTDQLANVIPKIRGGLAEEMEINRLRQNLQESPFNIKSLSTWLDCKEEESKVITQYLNIIEETPGVQFTFGPGDLKSVVDDMKYNQVISFEFKVVNKCDSFLQSMFSFLREQSANPDSGNTISPNQWHQNTNIMTDMRQKVKRFTRFAEANKDNDETIFVVSDSSDEAYEPENPRAVLLLYENGLPSEFEPPGQPGIPTATKVTDDSVQLEWKQPEYGKGSVKCYTVLYRSLDDINWKSLNTSTPTFEVKYLAPETEYVFMVRAECGFGSSEESKLSEIIETKSPLVNSKLQSIIANSEILSDDPLVIYRLPVRRVLVRDNVAKMEFGDPAHPPKPNRVLMVVGATGAGKSTLINGMVNYIFGVKWENKFRFKLIADEITKSQAHSQTQTITAYTFYWQEGSPIDYSLTVIDTPGFGDTRGLERDQEIIKDIREFFSIEGKDGIDVLDGIGFVMQASLARLTPTQWYISDSILSLFGKDVKDNIFIMTTFADGASPPVMGAVKEANIPFAQFFPFNNSALFETPTDSKFTKMFWQMGYSSFENFFVHFEKANSVSLQLTRQVLEERKQLQTIILEIQPQINAGLAKIDEIMQEEQILNARESDVIANKDFKYEIKVTKQKQIFTQKGVFVTNCATCHYTCHRSCAFEDDRDKWKCSSMSGDKDNAECEVCPGNCSWRKHFNNGYIFELYEEMETRTSEDLFDRYNLAKSEINSVEELINIMNEDLNGMHQAVLHSTRRARKCLQRLDEIALKPNPLTEVEYIDLLIKSEEQQKNAGWKNRIDYFYEVRQQAELLADMTDQDAVDEMIRESSRSLWKKFTGWVKSKLPKLS